MTAATQDIFVRIAADAQRYRRDMQVARGVTSGFAQHAKAEFGRLRAFMGTIHGQMVGLGVGFVPASTHFPVGYNSLAFASETPYGSS